MGIWRQGAAWRQASARRLLLACFRALVLWTVVVASVPGWGRDHDVPPPQPALRIGVAPLGYHPPGKLYLLAHYSSGSLDFLDESHLLFTFHEARLLPRTAHSNGLDQAIRATVVDLPSGQVTYEKELLLPDRQRYQWRLGAGEALLRIGNRLFTTDSTLTLKPLLQGERPVRAVDVSPDGRVLVLETDLERHTPEEHARLAKHAEEVGADSPNEDVQIRVIRMDEGKVRLNARAERAGRLPASAEGYLIHQPLKTDRWEVLLRPFEKQEGDGRRVAQVDSTCTPEEHFLNQQTVLVNSCPPKHGDRYVAAYSLQGEKLWDGRWPGNYLWPAYRVAASGSTVAVSWLAMNHVVSEFDGFDDSDVQAQVLSVLDTKTGALRMSLRLEPIISEGGNFALSPDGNRLAVVNHGALEVYNLPAAAPTETARR